MSFEVFDISTGRVVAHQKARGHARTRFGARRQIAKALAG